ncbi:MAG: hypothetical protein LKF06_04285 [Prevotella sp.]|jgi:hypothetical protein|nr:hypothetical protein [Prevotella sp.]
MTEKWTVTVTTADFAVADFRIFRQIVVYLTPVCAGHRRENANASKKRKYLYAMCELVNIQLTES